MIDYRKLSNSEVNALIASYSRTEELRENVLNGLCALSVWHSIKDGQVTPASGLVAAVRGKSKEQVVSYLTKFGNISFSKKGGIKYNKNKGKVQYGIEQANEVFDNLPTLEEAFPTKPKQYKDVPFANIIKNIISKATELQKHGKKYVFANDEEKAMFDMLSGMAQKAV